MRRENLTEEWPDRWERWIEAHPLAASITTLIVICGFVMGLFAVIIWMDTPN